MRTALRELRNNDPLRMAAATAFFTTFALPAILIIFIQLFGIVMGRRTMSQHLFEHLSLIIGDQGVSQIRLTLRGFRRLATNWYIGIGGFIFLIFVATTLFKVISDSLNQLWSIKVHSRSGVGAGLRGRLRSIGIIVLAGFLFLASLLIEAMQALLLDYINELWAGSRTVLYIILNQVVSALVVAAWFSVVFRYLANGRPHWKVAIAGGIVTSILFTLGKLAIGWLLGYSNIDNIFGAAGSFVLVLLFVFYASFILYFGATFTHAWAEFTQRPIKPGASAYRYEVTEIVEK
ncbi:MAG TPA: YihY/virulence factor BrkB family protein [Chitinophagaceae bacterium]|nr:YihY/virulence factor BrkB family protein [Chitinophagaceae bacterium]